MEEVTTWSAAEHAAAQVEAEDAATGLILQGLANAERDPYRAIVAGAVALRAHREGWTSALGTYRDSSRGRHRGGWDALETMTLWKNVAAGEFPEWAAAPIPDASDIAGNEWPAPILTASHLGVSG